MIEALLPGGVAAAEAFDDALDAYLFPAERAVVGNAVEKRRREFTTGRHLARLALTELGFAPAPLLPGPRREPSWPPGVVGSITHCSGYRAAVVALDASFVTLGIDAEPNGPLPDGVLAAIAGPDERRWVTQLLAGDPDVRWDRLLFSIKESVYKAWFPLARRWLGFSDAAVTLDPRSGAFDARLLVPGPTLPDGSVLSDFTGRWLVRDGLVLTAVVLPAPGSPSDTSP